MRKILALLCFGFGLGFAHAGAAERLACHYTYGGETQTLTAEAVASSYKVEPIAVGSYFLFRAVYEAPKAQERSAKIYVYADLAEGPSLIHQATYLRPEAMRRKTRFGFTGEQRVYEPARDGEIQYWCEMQRGKS